MSDKEWLKNKIKSQINQKIEQEKVQKAEAERARQAEAENARKAEEERIRREKERIELEKAALALTREEISTWLDYFLPMVAEHFENSMEPMEYHARIPHPRENRDENNEFFKIVDKETPDGLMEFHLEGQLEELGLGNEDSIPLPNLYDDRLPHILWTDVDNPHTTYWNVGSTYREWAIFHGRRRRNRPATESVITRLVDGVLTWVHTHVPSGPYERNREYRGIAIKKWGDKLALVEFREHHSGHVGQIVSFFDENMNLEPYPPNWPRGSSYTLPFADEFPILKLGSYKLKSKPRYPAISAREIELDEHYRNAITPNFSEKMVQQVLIEFFRELGLTFVAVDEDSFTLRIFRTYY